MPAEARKDHNPASDPDAFVWVAANAGSGKTHVLVERLVRILLAGTPPARILCLTFTNAAAAEMANRLFQVLSDWAVKSDAELTATISALTGEPPGGDQLARARRLFPTALESPGGPKIYTIHAFCERLLHRFALESGVSPHFSLVVDRDQRDLVEGAREAVLTDAATLTDSAPLLAALETVSSIAHDSSLADLLADLVSRRAAIAALDLDDPERRAAVFGWLAAKLGIDPEDSENSTIEAHFGDSTFDRGGLEAAAAVLAGGSPRDRKLAPRIRDLAQALTPQARYACHRAAFLKKDGAPVAESTLMTNSVADANPAEHALLVSEFERSVVIQRQFSGIATFAATSALLVLAEAVIAKYQAEKSARGLLDYDDLIERARNLLARSDDAAWVLYKLDGGIDHILVDEAQDTSPAQWEIVRYLAEDMLAGESARGVQRRSTFAVGDEKQSIFSFQGADPAMFATMHNFFAERVRNAGLAWSRVPLERSYRSAPEILAAVDLVFADPETAAGLGAGGTPARHEAYRKVPGLVEIWPTVAPNPVDPPDPWTAPVDHVGPADPRMRLAGMIADEITGWLRDKRMLEAEGRPILPGDIMILVRRRNSFVDAMVRALKARGVPVAGIDRMRLTGQIVVQDLISLGRFALLPEDDLSLAELVKSPLVGLTEDDLFAIAHCRSGSLWQSLLDKAHEATHLEAARARLADWLAMADRMPPHTFYARILAADGMRRRIAERLGAEAADPVEEFMNAALAFEREHVPSLEGFLAWLARSEGEIKRDMDHGRDEVRIMTVHGAKGLEANIVILPDTCQTPSGGRGIRLDDFLFPAPDIAGGVKIPVWPRQGGQGLDSVAEAREAAGRAASQEYLRLLYVAMTRARDWLIVTGYDTSRERPEGCWYNVIRRGLADHVEEVGGPDGAVRWRLIAKQQVPAVAPSTEAPQRAIAPAPLPDWALQPPVLGRTARTDRLTPSHAGAETEGAMLSPLAESTGRRFSRGLLMHTLLERLPALPRATWRDRAAQYLEMAARDLQPDMREGLVEESIRVLESADFAPFLTKDARAEVAFAATIDGPHGPVLIEGRVDRFANAGETVHIVDFKTHRPAPADIADVRPSQMAQMALYRAALSQLFPGKAISCALLWTDTARLMILPDSALDAALHTALTRSGQGSP